MRRDEFRWTSSDGTRGAFESTPGKLRHFCTRCGSHLMAEWRHRPMVILRIATADEGISVEPDAHIWADHQAARDHGMDDLPRFKEGRTA